MTLAVCHVNTSDSELSLGVVKAPRAVFTEHLLCAWHCYRAMDEAGTNLSP